MPDLHLLLAPAFAIMGIAFLFSLTLNRFSGSRSEQLAFGVMFGGAIVVGMTNPLTIGEGVIFDTRSLLIAVAVSCVGYQAGFVALVMGIACRVMIGGVGMMSGVAGLIAAFGLASLWHRFVYIHIRNKIIADASLGMAITPSLLALFLLPQGMAFELLLSIGPMLVTTNILGCVVLGLIFRREIAFLEHRRLMETHAHHDPLTNLLNRRGLEHAASRISPEASKGRAMLYFDVDNFKTINDTHGHDVGDVVLAAIADRIGQVLRSDAVFARQGGDEFSVLLPDIARGDVAPLADRLCQVIRETEIATDGKSVSASISMGAYWTRSDLGCEELTMQADLQLYAAKEAGKSRAKVGYDTGQIVSAA